VVKLALNEHHGMGDVPRSAIEQLDRWLAQPKANADLKFFNTEYRRRRLGARGESFMPYPAAEQRLRSPFVGVAAGDRRQSGRVRGRVMPRHRLKHDFLILPSRVR
jgi:hypothetical protein